MTNFTVGQKVVLAVPYGEAEQFVAFLNGDILPVPGVVYTIKEIEPVELDGLVFIRLNEISNPIPEGKEREAAFNSSRFRPVVERKTDISIFTALLNKTDKPVEEVA